MNSLGERESHTPRRGREGYVRQLARYQEALATILDVPAMSSDDVLENADYAFFCPELEVRTVEAHTQRAKLVGKTLVELGHVFQKWPEPPIRLERAELLARAAAVFSRRFETLADISSLTPDDSPAAARATLERVLAGKLVRVRGRMRPLDSQDIQTLSGALGWTQTIFKNPEVFADRFRSPDLHNRAAIWTALAESMPGIFHHGFLLRHQIVLPEEGRHLFITTEIPRWLNLKDEQWFKPERIFGSIRLLLEAIRYLEENGFVASKTQVSELIIAVQNSLIETLMKSPSLTRHHRAKIEQLYFQLEGFIPQSR